jgi:hypothetical protein
MANATTATTLTAPEVHYVEDDCGDEQSERHHDQHRVNGTMQEIVKRSLVDLQVCRHRDPLARELQVSG